MNKTDAQSIASRFLPSRWHYYYSRSKLVTDPLYDGVCRALAGNTAPLLDLGCGIGLLAHCLRLHHLPMAYFGVDNDAEKVQRAERAASEAGLRAVRFAALDLAQTFPAHRGSIALLDVLHYLPWSAQLTVLQHASACLIPGARLVIRTGLAAPGWRSKVTHAADALARAIGWMNTEPKHYPTRAALQAALQAQTLHVEFVPLWGNTPFNNWLVVAQRNQSGNTA